MYQFKGIFDFPTDEIRINLNGREALRIGIHVPVGAAEMFHGSPLNVPDSPVQMAGHAVPFIGYCKKYKHKIGDTHDEHRGKHQKEYGFEKRG